MNAEIESLIDRFRRMVARGGGELTVVADTPDAVRLRYRSAEGDQGCVDGACVLPHRELEQLMGETFARQHPGFRVEVEAA
jgi:hypothetical protein